jgi:hypothetical protein
MHGPGRKIRLGEGAAAHDLHGRRRDMNDRYRGSDPEPSAHGSPLPMICFLVYLTSSHPT